MNIELFHETDSFTFLYRLRERRLERFPFPSVVVLVGMLRSFVIWQPCRVIEQFVAQKGTFE